MVMMVVTKKIICRFSLLAVILAVALPVFAQSSEKIYNYYYNSPDSNIDYDDYIEIYKYFEYLYGLEKKPDSYKDESKPNAYDTENKPADNSAYEQHMRQGVAFYRESQWKAASNELRLALGGAATSEQIAEALYWLALSEIAAGEYVNSLRVLEILERFGGDRTIDIQYHRGRAYYYLGYYDESIVALNNYASRLPESERARKSAAYYWMGEGLLALGQLDRAKEIFTIVVEKYADSVKYEAASYRIAIINQKKVEGELLSLLKWTHEESLKTTDEYHRREKNFDAALSEYQKQLADESRDQTDNAKLLAEYRTRIEALEKLIAEQPGGRVSNDLRMRAQQLREDMENSAKVLELDGKK